jgi:WD40 repeat protein
MYEESHIKPGDDLLNAQMMSKENDLRDYEWYYLWHLYHRNLPTPNDLKYDVVAAAYSPDGKTLAKMGVDGTVELLDASSYEKLGSLPRFASYECEVFTRRQNHCHLGP